MDIKKVLDLRDEVGEIINSQVVVDDQYPDTIKESSSFDTAESILIFLCNKFDIKEKTNDG